MMRFLAATLAAGSLLLASPAAPAADTPPDEARRIAEKVTTAGAALFDAHDARAMGATYDEKALLTLFEKEDGVLTRQSHEGRAKIESLYAKVFENPRTIKSRNTVDRARLLAPDLLAIDGTFDVNTLDPNSPKVAFHQVRQRKDGKWLVLTMEISILATD